MKKIIGIVAASAFAIAAFSAPVAAGNDKTPVPGQANCFGFVHSGVVNAGALDGIDNVGQAIKALGGGQEKNALARSLCVVVD